MSNNTKEISAATNRKVFFETSVREELGIVEEYTERGERVVGWESAIIFGVAAFVLYLS